MDPLKNFLKVLFPDLEGGFIEVRSILPGVFPDGTFYPSIEAVIADWAAIEAFAQKTNMYVGVCPRAKKAGDKSAIRTAWCLWADLDGKDFEGGKDEALKRIRSFRIPPSIIVDSGRGYHCYWLFRNGVMVGELSGRAKVEDYLKGLVRALNGDSTAAEVARVLRLPGTLNHKYDPMPVVTIIELDAARKYDISDFDFLFDDVGTKESKSGEDTRNEPGWIAEALKNIKEGNRHATFLKITGRLNRDGWIPDDIYAILVPFAERVKFPLEELRSVVDGACERYSHEQTETTMDLPADPPRSLTEFMKQDIPPVEFHIDGVLQEKGKTMISAPTSGGKSIVILQAALAMASGADSLMGKFNVTPARVLYFDLEMGDPALQERLRKMCRVGNFSGKNLYLKSLPVLDLLNGKHKAIVEEWIADLKPDVVIFDPLGNAWSGKENEHDQVRRLTGYFNHLIHRYGVAVMVAHHWRKPTKDSKSGGHMAAGSYVWEAWADCHVTLKGEGSNVTFTSEKNRNRAKFSPFLAKINTDGLLFEYLSDYSKKYDTGTLERVFASFNLNRVAIPKLVKKAETDEVCSETLLRKLIKESDVFEVDTSGKTHYLYRKDNGRIQNGK